jgi:hypothetical protein
MPARREVLELELSRLLCREPRVVEERVQPSANVRVDVGSAQPELSDRGPDTICVRDHRHELVWNHEVERTDVRCPMEDGHTSERRRPSRAGCVLRFPSPLRRRYATGPAFGFLIGAGRRRHERSPPFSSREDAERFIEEVRGDDPELPSYLRIEAELETGGLNRQRGAAAHGSIGLTTCAAATRRHRGPAMSVRD